MALSPEPDWRNDFSVLPPTLVNEALNALPFDSPAPALTTPVPEDSYRSPAVR